MTRILLFAATNVAVLVVLSVVAKLLGLDAYLAARGGSLTGLLWLSAIFGFGGAFISLALSKRDGEIRDGRTGHRSAARRCRGMAHGHRA